MQKKSLIVSAALFTSVAGLAAATAFAKAVPAWPPGQLGNQPQPVPRPPPGPVNCLTTVNPIHRQACCAKSGNAYNYCGQFVQQQCVAQGVPGHWIPWQVNGGTVCCPPGQIPTGNSQPQQVCVLPSQVPNNPQVLNQPVLQASMSWPVIASIIGGHIGLLACYDQVTFNCWQPVFQGLLPATTVKRCLEIGYARCLETAGVFMN